MSEVIAVLHNYRVGVTCELSPGQVDRLGEFLNQLAKENGDRLTTGVVWGKVDVQELTTLYPLIGSANG